MKGIVFAVVAGSIMGIAALLNKLGMKYTDPVVGSVILVSSTFLTLLIFLFVTGKQRLLTSLELGSFVLVISGILVGIFLYFLLSAYQCSQVRIVLPIQFSLKIVVGVVTAILFLGERLTLLGGVGIFVIMVGIILIVVSQFY